jgi:hypothetical protein
VVRSLEMMAHAPNPSADELAAFPGGESLFEGLLLLSAPVAGLAAAMGGGAGGGNRATTTGAGGGRAVATSAPELVFSHPERLEGTVLAGGAMAELPRYCFPYRDGAAAAVEEQAFTFYWPAAQL